MLKMTKAKLNKCFEKHKNVPNVVIKFKDSKGVVHTSKEFYLRVEVIFWFFVVVTLPTKVADEIMWRFKKHGFIDNKDVWYAAHAIECAWVEPVYHNSTNA